MYIELYVNPSVGSDSNIGTMSNPYKTISKAADVIREICQSASDDAEYTFCVMLSDAVHIIDSTVNINGIGQKIIFKPYDDMYATITGLIRVNNSILKAEGNNLFSFELKDSNGCPIFTKDIYLNSKKLEQYPNVSDFSDLSENSFFADYGCGKYTLRTKDGEDMRYCALRCSVTPILFNLCGCKNIFFENIDFYACSVTESGGIASVFYLDGCSNIEFNRCRFNKINSYAVYARNSSRGLNIHDCEFTDAPLSVISIADRCGDLQTPENGAKIINNRISDCESGICIKSDNLFEISHNTFEYIRKCIFNFDGSAQIALMFNRIEKSKSDFSVLSGIRLLPDSYGGLNYIAVSDADAFAGVFSDSEEVKSKAGYRKKIRNYGDVL